MDKSRRGPWTVRAVARVFDNPWIAIDDHDVLRPDGAPGQYGVVAFKNIAVGVLPVDADGCVWMVGQHRFPSDTYSWELPEGGGPVGTPALETAKRELAEETGLSAANWAPLAEFDVSNSVTDERSECFLAWTLTEGDAAPEPTEELSLKRVPFHALVDHVLAGRVRDSLTIVMTLTALAKAQRGELPGDAARLLLAK